MFLALCALCASKRPIILIPGLMGSILNGDILGKTSWYCPSKEKNVNIWFNDRYAVPPTYKCLFNYIKLVWNEKTKEPEQPSYVNMTVVDFGGINGINHVDTALFGIHIVPYYSVIIDHLKKNGWGVGTDIFGIPFDWRFGLYQKDHVWKDIINLVEDIFQKTGEKVTIAGHSMGGFLLHHLLTAKTTKEWRQKYMAGAVFIAPSFGGSGLGFNAIWSKKIPFLEFLGEFPDVLPSMGGIHVHMLNKEIFGNVTAFVDENGTNHTASELTKILRDSGKLPDDFYNIYMKNEPFTNSAPADIDIPKSIIYNSGLPTALGTNMSDSGKHFYGMGDLMVNKEGPEWVCNHWSSPECHDLQSANPVDNHLTLMYRQKTLDIITDFLERI